MIVTDINVWVKFDRLRPDDPEDYQDWFVLVAVDPWFVSQAKTIKAGLEELARNLLLTVHLHTADPEHENMGICEETGEPYTCGNCFVWAKDGMGSEKSGQNYQTRFDNALMPLGTWTLREILGEKVRMVHQDDPSKDCYPDKNLLDLKLTLRMDLPKSEEFLKKENR